MKGSNAKRRRVREYVVLLSRPRIPNRIESPISNRTTPNQKKEKSGQNVRKCTLRVRKCTVREAGRTTFRVGLGTLCIKFGPDINIWILFPKPGIYNIWFVNSGASSTLYCQTAACGHAHPRFPKRSKIQ